MEPSRVTVTKPAIGRLPLRQLQPSHLQKLYNEKSACGLSARTVRLIHTIMHAALKQAMKEGLAARNVAEATTLPKQARKEPRVLTLQEQKRFFEVLLIFQGPKSEKGRRSIPLPEWAIAALKAHKVRQNQERLALGEAYQGNGLVFATEDGSPIDPRNFTRSFYRLVQKTGIGRANLHALRHTYATRLLERDEHPKVVQELLGHSQISVTLDTYGHVLPELKKQAAAKLEDLWPKEKAPSAAEGN